MSSPIPGRNLCHNAPDGDEGVAVRTRQSIVPAALLAAAMLVSVLPISIAPATAQGEIPPGTPECPPALAETVLRDDTQGVRMTPDGESVLIDCTYSSPDWDVTPRYDPATGLYRAWGSADIHLRFDIGPRRNPCPADAGVLDYTEGEDTWPSGLAGSWIAGSGRLPSATHHAELSWSLVVEDGITPDLVEATAMDLFAEAEQGAVSCLPDEPGEPIGRPQCPAMIGDYVLYENVSEVEPEIVERDTRPDYLRSRCTYHPGYRPEDYDPLEEHVISLRIGWIEEPVSADDGLDRPGETCTSLRVPVDLGEDRYLAESDTHVVRIVGDGNGGDPAAIAAAFDEMISGLEGVASPCPATAPEEPEEAPVEEPEQPAPDSCAPQGTVTDQLGSPMPGLRVQLWLSGEVADQRVTDEDGWYQFADLGFLADAYQFDPAADGYEVGVVLRDAVGGEARFEIRYGEEGVLPEVRRGPRTVADDPACSADFDFTNIGDDYTVVAGPEIPNAWRSLALAYQSTRKANGLAEDVLGTPLTMTPLKVYMYCRGRPPGVHGGRCGTSPAFFRGGFSSEEEPEGPPFIALNVPFSNQWDTGERPFNGEYHEFGHALMADAFGGFMPNVPDSVNHAGYANPTSTDSWTEGFAEWFSTQVTRHVDGRVRWWLYPISGQIISLEDDRVVTGNQGKDEELAIAAILVDMVDGDADYTAPTRRQLTVTGAADFTDPDDPERRGVGVEIRNDTGVEQRDIGIKGDFGGFAGAFSTRVDGFVEPDVLQPGETGTAVIPYPGGSQWSDLNSVEVVGLAVGDDDGIARTAAEVWQAILAYRSTSQHSKGHVMDASELYEALRDGFPADTAAIDAVFVAHGVFADTEPRNGIHDPGESIGITSPDGSRLRTDYQTPEVFQAVVDTGDVPARVQVQVLYPEPRDALSYAYTAVPDPETAVVSVAVPPASTGAVVRMVVRADGYLPVLLPDLHAEDFWAQADANGYRPFMTYQAALTPGDAMADAVAVNASGAPILPGGFPLPLILALAIGVLVIAAGGVWWWRRRVAVSGAGGTVPPPPPSDE
ncbi:MAG: hypothetical protein KKE89_08545 [Actinobacteria bacterium]|nr:hypothetical protein [Actinomycetota bacterium]